MLNKNSMAVRDHFPICRNFCAGIFFGLFCWIFCVTILWYFCVGLLVAGRFYMVPLAYDNGMVPRYGEKFTRKVYKSLYGEKFTRKVYNHRLYHRKGAPNWGTL